MNSPATALHDDNELHFHNDVPRLLVLSNTRKTRESWFARLDIDAYRRLHNSIPKVPEPLPTPTSPDVHPLSHDVRHRVLLLITAALVAIALANQLGDVRVSGMSSGFRNWLISMSGYEVSTGIALLPVFINLIVSQFKARTPAKKMRAILTWLGLGVVVTASGLGAWYADTGRSMIVPDLRGVRVGVHGLITVGLVIQICFAIYKVRAHNNRVRLAEVDFARRKQEHLISERRRFELAEQHAEVLRRIRQFDRDCLAPTEMAKLRVQAMNTFFEMATAEVNVPPQEAAEIFKLPGQRFLEIVAPDTKWSSRYPRPVVRVDLGLGPATERDTPIVHDLLAHRYQFILAMILQQGLAIVHAVHDSVEQTTTIESHDLVLWKSISRVTRQNVASSNKGDLIILETFGGSTQSLPVNGELTQEYVALIESVRITGRTTGPIGLPAPTPHPQPGRQVNAFVREIQIRMSAHA